MNQREILPLLDIVSHDPVLSMPQLHRMNNVNLRVIQDVEDELASTDTFNTWIIAGVALSVILSGFMIIWKI